jgi:integrase
VSDNRPVADGLSSRLLALEWLLGGLTVGLRPSEWSNARIDLLDGVETLVVRNRNVHLTAAGKFWRGNGETRQIYLSHLLPDDLARVRRLVRLLNQAREKGEFDRVYRLCREVLCRANVSFWPTRRTHITLYSGRHQFSTDAKAEGLPLEKLAALLGHRSAATATRHYGKKKQGTAGRSRLKADPAAVPMSGYR